MSYAVNWSDDALDTCEVCASPAVRVLHAPAVHFKGSGFYNTDYGTKKRARERSASAEGRAKSSGECTSRDSSRSTSLPTDGSGGGTKKADAA